MDIIGDILISGDRSGNIFLLNAVQHGDPITHLTVGYCPKGFLHPPTYLNKMLILGDEQLQLWNVRSDKLIYDFTESSHTLGKILTSHADKDEAVKTQKLQIGSNLVGATTENEMTLQLYGIANSPALDIVSVALSDGRVLLLNLREDKVIQKLQSEGFQGD